MTILMVPDVAPSRVLGVYRYLLKARGQRESRATLEGVLMPDSLVRSRTDTHGPNRGMVQQVLSECLSMGLLQESDGFIQLGPDLPSSSCLLVSLIASLTSTMYLSIESLAISSRCGGDSRNI